MNLMMALEANRQEELYLVEPISEPSSPMVNLTRHLASAHLADWVVGQELLSNIFINFVLAFSLCRYSA
jgi:hypothetical protein